MCLPFFLLVFSFAFSLKVFQMVLPDAFLQTGNLFFLSRFPFPLPGHFFPSFSHLRVRKKETTFLSIIVVA